MSDKKQPAEKMPEQTPEKTEEKQVEEPQPEAEIHPKTEFKDIKQDQTEEQTETSIPEKKQPSQEKPEEIESKKEEKPKKKGAHKDDFKYIVRIAGTDLDGEKKALYGLTSIKGIGLRLGIIITDAAGVNRSEKLGNLTDEQINHIQQAIDNIQSKTPVWMLNRRKDYDTGSDVHLIGADVSMTLRDDINRLRMIRAYQGVRHELGLRVRGQRTRSHPRSGLAMGVSRKAQQQKAAKKSE